MRAWIVALSAHAADRLVDPSVCAAPGAWAGTWDGERPFDTGKRSDLTITKSAAVAACFDAQGALHVWRILDASGQGIQSTHEEDGVVLQRR